MADEETRRLSEDRDQILKRIIEKNLKSHANSHVGDLESLPPKDRLHPRGYNYYSETHNVATKEGITLVMAPAWGILFPPYNIARLTGLLRHYDYDVKVYDTNVECYHHIRTLLENPDIDHYWHGQFYYMWQDPVFSEKTFPQIKHIIDRTIDEIVNSEHTLIGFSMYTSNQKATMYMIRKIKELDPTKTIVIGGPQAFNEDFEQVVLSIEGFDSTTNCPIDYRITGEGEQEILNLLDTYKTSNKKPGEMITLGGFRSRLDLNQLPYPDYDDYDLSLYDYPNGVSIESSRGCVALCSFCAETYFWKYRYRKSDKIVAEIKHQMERYGTRHFWFVDSLANGAFTEFKNLVHHIVEEGLDISWNSYARCDGRMDADLFKVIAKSGCNALSFGVENGSQKVLNDMKKKVEIWEIENNLRDGFDAGLINHINWVVGFPTETPEDFVHSLQLVHNIRKWVYAISPGATCNLSPFSDILTKPEQFDIVFDEKIWDRTFIHNWYAKDYKNTIVQRFIRLKFMNIWLWLAKHEAGGIIANAQHVDIVNELYTFKRLTDSEITDYTAQHTDQDFQYFKGDTIQEQFAANLANEHLPYAWVLYQVYGPFEMEIVHDPAKDLELFGRYTASVYNAVVKMRVDTDGILHFSIRHSFNHIAPVTIDEDYNNRVLIKERAVNDMSFIETEHLFVGDISYFDTKKQEN